MSITKGIIILQIYFQQARKMNTRSKDAGVTIFTFRLAVVPQENNFCKWIAPSYASNAFYWKFRDCSHGFTLLRPEICVIPSAVVLIHRHILYCRNESFDKVLAAFRAHWGKIALYWFNNYEIRWVTEKCSLENTASLYSACSWEFSTLSQENGAYECPDFNIFKRSYRLTK